MLALFILCVICFIVATGARLAGQSRHDIANMHGSDGWRVRQAYNAYKRNA